VNKIIERYKDTLSINEIKTLSKIDSKSILFFDLDGTLIDSDYANFLSYKKAIQEIINPNNDILYDINKRFTRQTIKELFPTINQINFEKIIQRKNK
jgi:FMN phosphatase YigB (HAD superfamily)